MEVKTSPVSLPLLLQSGSYLVAVDSWSWWVIFMKYANTVTGQSKQMSKHEICWLRTIVLQSSQQS